jgi:methionyl aminopeptidase
MTDEASRAAMRAVGHLAAQALQLAGSMAVPGTTTDDIDAAVHAFLVENGAYPSPLKYHGFPKSVCTSVNEVVCHGERRLEVWAED